MSANKHENGAKKSVWEIARRKAKPSPFSHLANKPIKSLQTDETMLYDKKPSLSHEAPSTGEYNFRVKVNVHSDTFQPVCVCGWHRCVCKYISIQSGQSSQWRKTFVVSK